MDSQWGHARPIETRYAGHRFRSRLEARWAVFFDALGITWNYEIEGFDLDGTWYLPDFWLPGLGWWIEVKPDLPISEQRLSVEASNRVMALGTHTRQPVLLLEGGLDPLEVAYRGGYLAALPTEDGGALMHVGCMWGACLACGLVMITDGGYRVPLDCGHGAIGTSPDLAQAFTAARSSRFERGR